MIKFSFAFHSDYIRIGENLYVFFFTNNVNVKRGEIWKIVIELKQGHL